MAMRSHAQLRHPGARLESSNVAAHARTCLWRFFLLLLLLERGPSCPLCSTFTNNSPTAKISEHPGIRACRPMRSSIGLTPLRHVDQPVQPAHGVAASTTSVVLSLVVLSLLCRVPKRRTEPVSTGMLQQQYTARGTNLPVASRLPPSRSSTDE